MKKSFLLAQIFFCKKKKCFGKYTFFLIKFLLLVTVLYLIWIPFASAYFSVILTITAAYFNLIGIEVSLNPTPDFLYSQGIRSCIPPFIALILATPGIKWKRMSFLITLGIPALFVFRTILQISYVYLQIPPVGEFYAIFVIFLSGTCRVALPFLLWFALTYKQILPAKRVAKEGFYICPFCGAEKVGIFDHIKDVHGEEALKSEEVKQLLKHNSQIKYKIKKF
jgi:hypothetical protein